MRSGYLKSVFFLAILIYLHSPVYSKTFFHPERNQSSSQIKITDRTTNLRIICSSNRICKRGGSLSLQESILNYDKPKLDLSINSDKDVTIVLDKNSHVKQVDIILSSVRNLKIYGNGRVNISILRDSSLRYDFFRYVKSICISGSTLSKIDLSSTNLDSIKLIGDIVSFLNLKEANVTKGFTLKNIRLDSANFLFTLLPQILWFHSVNLTRTNAQIDLTRLKDIPLEGSKELFKLERTMKISNTNLDKMKIDYDRFNFHVDSAQTMPNRIWIYEKIIKHTFDSGLIGKSKYYNWEYTTIMDSKNRKLLTNAINVLWWSRGSNKTKALVITCSCYLSFVFANFFLFSKLRQVYYPDTFRLYFSNLKRQYVSLNQIKKTTFWGGRVIKYDLNYIFGIFIYTGFIFWGIRLDIHDVKIHRQWLFTYLLIQYLIGLLFVANIINFLVVKL